MILDRHDEIYFAVIRGCSCREDFFLIIKDRLHRLLESKFEMSVLDVYQSRNKRELCMGVPGGGRGRRQPPQFVGQTKPVGQYSLYSRAILAYY